MLRYFASIGINLDSRVRILARRESARIISAAIESASAAVTTVELGNPGDPGGDLAEPWSLAV